MAKSSVVSKEIRTVRYSTTDYSIFGFITGNRSIHLTGTDRKNQRESLRKHGWFECEPAKVIPHQGKLLVIDGQNRIKMAEELGIPVIYEILNITYEEATELIPDLQIAKSWDQYDYIHSWASKGKKDYITIQKFARDHNISQLAASSLLYNNLPSSGNVREFVKNGTFRVVNMDFANNVVSVFSLFSSFKEIQSNRNLLTACAKVLLVKEFDRSRLKKKIEVHSHMVKNVHSCENFLQMIEDIYNKGSSLKVNLKFLAERAAKARSACRDADFDIEM